MLLLFTIYNRLHPGIGQVCALSPKVIAQFQKLDKELLRKSGRPKSNYQTVELEDEVLIAHNGKVMVPEALQDRLIDQYHNLLNHQV